VWHGLTRSENEKRKIWVKKNEREDQKTNGEGKDESALKLGKNARGDILGHAVNVTTEKDKEKKKQRRERNDAKGGGERSVSRQRRARISTNSSSRAHPKIHFPS